MVKEKKCIALYLSKSQLRLGQRLSEEEVEVIITHVYASKNILFDNVTTP